MSGVLVLPGLDRVRTQPAPDGGGRDGGDDAGLDGVPLVVSNRQYLWIEIFYAASSVAVVSSGRSTSLPFSNFAPARTSATRWGALTARQRDWAASISL